MSSGLLEVGDSVRTKNVMFFVEAVHPDTGHEIEVRFPRWHRLTVVGVNPSEGTVDVLAIDGHVATLDVGDVEE